MLNSTIPRSFGKLLRDRREELDFTLQDVADALGTSATFIWKVEQGVTSFPADHLKGLAAKLNMNPDLLMVEYVSPLMDRIYKRAGMGSPAWRIIPANLKVSEA